MSNGASSFGPVAAAVVVTVVATVLLQRLAPGWMAPLLGGAAGLGIGIALALLDVRRTGGRLVRLRRAIESIGVDDDAPTLIPPRRDDLADVEHAASATAGRVAGALRDLTVEQDRLQAILRGMVEGVVVTDLDGRIVLTNQRAREMLDLSDDVLVRGPALVDVARAPALAELMRDLREGAPVVTRDVQLQGPGEPTVQMNAARLDTEDETAFGYVMVIHDVTELRRLEVVRRDFVANVSHELRTPLTAIKGYAETLLGTAGDDRETARRFLQVIDRHSERLGRLIDDLLALSDLELGRTPLQLTEVDVALAVDDVLQMFSEVSVRKGIRLLADVASGDVLIAADGDRLRQVLINLVDNAIKYTPDEGQVTVHVRADPDDTTMVRIAVEDTGAGIPARDLPRLTERFFRVDKARSRELGGTGLGLAIVKHIVQLHGGRLEVASAIGQGTTVTAMFPKADSTFVPRVAPA